MKVPSIHAKGFKEVVYMDALEIELKKANVIYERERPFDTFYEGELLKHRFDAGFYIDNKIIIEAKATSFIPADSCPQTLHYLKASLVVKPGIMVNYGTDKLEFKRIILTGNNS